VRAPQPGEVEVDAGQPAPAFEVPDPPVHPRHQVVVEAAHRLEVRAGGNGEPNGRPGGEADLAVVLVAPVDGDLVTILLDGAPEP
jgi:hypothetical protein